MIWSSKGLIVLFHLLINIDQKKIGNPSNQRRAGENEWDQVVDWLKRNYVFPFQPLDTRWSSTQLAEDGRDKEEDAVSEDGDGERDGASGPARRWVQGGHQPRWEDWGVGGFSFNHMAKTKAKADGAVANLSTIDYRGCTRERSRL